jgi:hypothetical protein
MQEQEKVGKARMIGYALGAIVFVAVALWRFVIR